MAIALRQDVQIGIQFVVKGEKVEIQELLNLLSLFLSVAIPTMLTIQQCAMVVGAIIGGINDTLDQVKIGFWPLRRNLLIIYIGLCLVGILVGAMLKR